MFDIVAIVSAAGIFGVTAIIFAECGIFLGFFLPGDSLLFTAGFLASQGVIDIVPLIIFTLAAAIIGESVGFEIGRRIGPMIFNKPRSRFFNPEHVHRAHEFFLHHGNKAIFLARFVPIIRTFVPLVAGVAGMPYRRFLIYNIVGGVAWVLSMTLLGYTLGRQLENAEQYLYPIVIGIIVLSFIPAGAEWHRARKKRAHHSGN